MAAPTGKIPANKVRFWVNPCGATTASDSETDLILHGTDLLSNIALQANMALFTIDEFKSKYVYETFKVQYEAHHDLWKNSGYEWLYPREVPKDLTTDSQYFSTLDVENFLKDSYKLLQIMAVAMEQVVWDQTDSEFKKTFELIKAQLSNVLCEIHLAMLELRVVPYGDVERKVMDDSFRTMEAGAKRDLRDWFILRDYMMALKYIRSAVAIFIGQDDSVPKLS